MPPRYARAGFAFPVGVDSLFPVVDSLAFVGWTGDRYPVSRPKFSFFACFPLSIRCLFERESLDRHGATHQQ